MAQVLDVRANPKGVGAAVDDQPLLLDQRIPPLFDGPPLAAQRTPKVDMFTGKRGVSRPD